MAETALLKYIQGISFPTEVLAKCQKLQKSSKIYLFNPMLDEDGIIRCRSRLEKSGDLSFGEKFPILLDGRNHFVRLLIAWIHETKCKHAQGISTNLHHVRTEFLILRARSSINKVLRGCKSYIALFVCPVSRAIHLELTPDLTTFEFLLVLRKFISRFPSVTRIMSDNAATFKRAEKELEMAYRNAAEPEIQHYLAKAKIEWEFITDRAPVQGAFWERMVQLVKKPLRKVLGTNVPRFRELESILAEIELCINLRPISALPSEFCEIRALCPMDLVYGYHAKARFPDSSKMRMPDQGAAQAIILTKAWKRQQTVLNAFWKRFQSEYLQQLRSAHESKPGETRSLRVGDVCILADPSPSRSFWPLCKIVDVFGGQRTDLRQRSCMIQFGNGKIVKRPISMIYPLGFSEN
ncbi:uncharacterized protein LOC100901094 [Galendromus occidentalis]|uniref:Uncharacterized protein LOC100901094 n=1 Tax=Galendromus occidentalis TaxID=34638 RepID=A0AAJ6VUD4_9ACAR|nr:uncharacterized protein LOC100901094 [Galendromus occidentalis]